MAPQPPSRAVLIDIGEALDLVTDAVAQVQAGDTITDIGATRYHAYLPSSRHGTIRVTVDFGDVEDGRMVFEELAGATHVAEAGYGETGTLTVYIRPRRVGL